MADLRQLHTRRLDYSERLQMGLVESVKAWMYPSEADHIHLSGEMSAFFACQRMKERMMQSESGRRVLAERPRLRTPFFDKSVVEKCAPNTLGGAYHKFLSTYGYEFDERPKVRYMPDDELAYIYQRYKEIHDFYHVCLNQGVTVYAELLVKVFEYAQTTLPSAGMTVVIGPPYLAVNYGTETARKIYFEEGPRMVRIAKKAKDFMSIMFEEHLHEDYEKFRMWVFNAEDEDDEALE